MSPPVQTSRAIANSSPGGRARRDQGRPGWSSPSRPRTAWAVEPGDGPRLERI